MVLTLYPDGTLCYKVPKGVLTPTPREALSEHKAALHALVEAFEERLAWVCIQSARDV